MHSKMIKPLNTDWPQNCHITILRGQDGRLGIERNVQITKGRRITSPAIIKSVNNFYTHTYISIYVYIRMCVCLDIYWLAVIVGWVCVHMSVCVWNIEINTWRKGKKQLSGNS